MNLVQQSIYQRTFHLRVNKSDTGSCFALGLNGSFCLITAKHLVKCFYSGKIGDFDILRKDKWFSFRGTPYYHADDCDIAIIKTGIPSKDESTPEFNSTCTLGDDAFFLGFPYSGYAIKYPSARINDNFPIPFIKKSIISAVLPKDDLIFLDGHNNPGFSGGPVVYFNHKINRHTILGVVSGYILHNGKVTVCPSNSNLIYGENSGIVVCYNIKRAVKLINTVFNTSLS